MKRSACLNDGKGVGFCLYEVFNNHLVRTKSLSLGVTMDGASCSAASLSIPFGAGL